MEKRESESQVAVRPGYLLPSCSGEWHFLLSIPSSCTATCCWSFPEEWRWETGVRSPGIPLGQGQETRDKGQETHKIDVAFPAR